VIVVSIVLIMPLALLVPSGGVTIAVQGLMGILICVFLFFLARRGYVHPVAYLLVWLFWGFNTVIVITSGGIHANAFNNYLFIILTAGLLLGTKTGVAITVLCALVGTGVVIAEANGTLPPSMVEQSLFTLLYSQYLRQN
jgi:hypothetical protein